MSMMRLMVLVRMKMMVREDVEDDGGEFMYV